MNHMLKINDKEVIIQSCDKTFARIGICFKKAKNRAEASEIYQARFDILNNTLIYESSFERKQENINKVKNFVEKNEVAILGKIAELNYKKASA